MATGYVVNTGTAAVALVAATAKTVLLCTSNATKQFTLVEFGVAFDGTSSTAVPVLIELVAGTAATAGTSTAFTPLLVRGDPNEVAACTAGIAFTVEPTVLTPLKSWLVSPTAGLLVQSPLGREITSTVAAASARKALGLRITAPAAVNVRAYWEVEE